MSSALSTPPPSHPDAAEPLFQVASILISQVISLLSETITTDAQLSYTSELIPGSTIGKHLRSVLFPSNARHRAGSADQDPPRHIHDHFRLLLASLPGSSSTLALSYDTRSRNLDSETSHPAALESFVSLRQQLDSATRAGRGVPSARKVLLEAVTPVVVELESTWGREVSPFPSFRAGRWKLMPRLVVVVYVLACQ